MKQVMRKDQALFDGKLSDELRRRFRNKRLQMGLSYQRLAAVFGADWSTIRKWECGPTKSCSIALRQKLIDFLSGEYDKDLNENNTHAYAYIDELPKEVRKCMERISHAHYVLHYRPDLRKSLLIGINTIITKILQALIDKKKMDVCWCLSGEKTQAVSAQYTQYVDETNGRTPVRCRQCTVKL
ncbi:MAG: helix-turn-helix transcriptional regulator [Oligosphaeraceae bacterium]|nr:helix-turn-helix transcriptional regulator [Oligosphaeraceae bacterium]